MGLLDSIKNYFHKETPDEAMKRYKRMLGRTSRELERERARLLQQEKKIQSDMRLAARNGQNEEILKIQAKDLIKTRNNARRCYQMKCHMDTMLLKVTTVQSSNDMMRAMLGVSRAMRQINARMQVPQLAATMREFDMQNEKMGYKEEMLNEAMDEVFDDNEDVTADADTEVQRVVDEVTLDFKNKVGVSSAPIEQEASQDMDDLTSRLETLKSGAR